MLQRIRTMFDMIQRRDPKTHVYIHKRAQIILQTKKTHTRHTPNTHPTHSMGLHQRMIGTDRHSIVGCHCVQGHRGWICRVRWNDDWSE